MPEKFIVPQFIENEDKILGPITVRQFILVLVSLFAMFIEYKIFTFGPFIAAAIVTAGIGGVFGFMKVNGQPFHIFFLNFVQTLSRPSLRVWDKHPTDAELRMIIKPQTIAEPEEQKPRRKPRPGGVYEAEEGMEHAAEEIPVSSQRPAVSS
jgi:hypothetical protein